MQQFFPPSDHYTAQGDFSSSDREWMICCLSDQIMFDRRPQEASYPLHLVYFLKCQALIPYPLAFRERVGPSRRFLMAKKLQARTSTPRQTQNITSRTLHSACVSIVLEALSPDQANINFSWGQVGNAVIRVPRNGFEVPGAKFPHSLLPEGEDEISMLQVDEGHFRSFLRAMYPFK